MAIIKKTDLKAMDNSALSAKLAEISAELQREKGVAKNTGKPANTGRMQGLKKLRARIKTMLFERGIRT